MANREDDRFRPRPAPPKARGNAEGQRFLSTVRRQMSRAGHGSGGRSQGRGTGRFGRGQVAARFASNRQPLSARRVVIKSRFVRLKTGSSAIASHLRYIERSQGDRHQFRFIVSPEDAREIGDLKDYTRALMARMSVDLQTRLDWVAVDHWDTDNPHTHIVLRGRADNGQDLVIAPEYMGHGMRVRAGEIATEWLGPRTS